MSELNSKRSKDKAEEKNPQPGLDQQNPTGASLFSLRLSSLYTKFEYFSHRIRLHGWKRLFTEALCEGLTAGVIGLTAFTLVGIPILDRTKQDWKAPEDFAVTVLDRHDNVIGTRGALHADSVSIEEMPDYVIKAVLATEDRRFFEHWGIDFVGLGRALNRNLRAHGVVQGGSTLSQQLAKILFLSNERTFQRKLKEAYLALWLEANLSKKEILQLYLDRAYMGGGTFGITAAAQFYFGKDVRDISLAEAAMLAGLFKAPGKIAPHVNLPAARARANVVLSNLVDSGFMSEGQVVSSRLNPATVTNVAQSKSPDYFIDWVFDEVREIGQNFPERALIVRSTLDPGIQKAADEAITYYLRQYGEQLHIGQAAAVVLDNDGSVRAIIGGRDYGESQFNRATQKGRPPGSSFKPYVYAVGLERGLTPQTEIVDAPINWDGWSPHNYGRSYAGRVDLTTALARSINTVPVRITYQYLKRDTQPIIDLIHNMGIEANISSHKTMVLGISNMTAMDQATGYNVFANGGLAGNRHGFTQINTADGRILWDWKRDGEKPRRVLSEHAAADMNYMLSQVPVRGSGRRAALPMTVAAGKTGTSQDYRDAWFVGYTGNYVMSVWVGNDDYSPMNKVTGGLVPAMIWNRTMMYAHQQVALKPLIGVDNSILANAKPQMKPDGTPMANNVVQIISSQSLDIIRSIGKSLRETPDFTLSESEHIASPMTLHIR